jgi:hypothetical protein
MSWLPHNVAASTSHNPMGLHGLLKDSFTFFTSYGNYTELHLDFLFNLRRCRYLTCMPSKCRRMNWVGFWRKQSWLIWNIIPTFAWKSWGKRQNSSDRTSGVQIRIEDLVSIYLERHSTTGQLGVKSEIEDVLFRIYLLLPGAELLVQWAYAPPRIFGSYAAYSDLMEPRVIYMNHILKEINMNSGTKIATSAGQAPKGPIKWHGCIRKHASKSHSIRQLPRRMWPISWKLWSSEWHPCFVFWRSGVRSRPADRPHSLSVFIFFLRPLRQMQDQILSPLFLSISFQ